MKLFNRVSRRILSRGRKRPPFRLSFELVRGSRYCWRLSLSTARRIQFGPDGDDDPAPGDRRTPTPPPGPRHDRLQHPRPRTVHHPAGSPRCRRSPTRSTWMGPPNALSSAYLPPALRSSSSTATGYRATAWSWGPAPRGAPIGWRNPSSAGSTIIGLDIYNFTGGSGIHIQTNDNLITGNFLGTDVNGTAAGPGNGTGRGDRQQRVEQYDRRDRGRFRQRDLGQQRRRHRHLRATATSSRAT